MSADSPTPSPDEICIAILEMLNTLHMLNHLDKHG